MEKVKIKRKKDYFLLAIFIAIILIVAGVIRSGRMVNKEKNTVLQKPTPVPAKSDWSTYTPEDNNFQFDHPASLPNCKVSIDLKALSKTNNKLKLLDTYCESGVRVMQVVYEKSDKEINSWWYGLSKENKENFEKFGKDQQVDFAGKKARMINYSQESGNSLPKEAEFLLSDNGYNYLIVFPDYFCSGDNCDFRDAERKMAGSFKIINSLPIGQVSVYKCPENGWVDCMPGIGKNNELYCSKEAEAWYKSNCPNFEGLAY